MVSTRETIKHDETSGILLKLSAIGLTMALLALPAHAQSPSPAQARKWCFANDSRGSNDRRFAGCSALLKANPDDVHALANRGEMLRRRSEAERAVADFDLSIKFDPNYGPAYGNRARIYRERGDRSRALADFARSLDLSPNNDRDYYARANMYFASTIMRWRSTITIAPSERMRTARTCSIRAASPDRRLRCRAEHQAGTRRLALRPRTGEAQER